MYSSSSVYYYQKALQEAQNYTKWALCNGGERDMPLTLIPALTVWSITLHKNAGNAV